MLNFADIRSRPFQFLVPALVVLVLVLAIISRVSQTAHHAISQAGLATYTSTDLDPVPMNNPVTIFFEVVNKDDDSPAILDVDHERRLHTMIISADLEKFEHFHSEDQIGTYPRRESVGEWPLIVNFNRAGRYLVAQNFTVAGKRLTDTTYFDIEGEDRMSLYQIDTSRSKRFGDYQVSLSAPETIRALEPTQLVFSISRGGPLNNLQPHLGAAMHLAVVRADLRHFIHTHGAPVVGGEQESHEEHHADAPLPASFGPDIVSTVAFPTKGLYKIFGEFKHANKVFDLNFMVEVD